MLQEVILDMDYQILAKYGDVIGIHYNNDDDVGVIPFEDERKGLCCGLNDEDMSRFYRDSTKGELSDGYVVASYTSRNYSMLPALQPIIGITFLCNILKIIFVELQLYHHFSHMIIIVFFTYDSMKLTGSGMYINGRNWTTSVTNMEIYDSKVERNAASGNYHTINLQINLFTPAFTPMGY